MLLQKHKDSKRVYAQIIHSKTNSDGAKEDGKSMSAKSCLSFMGCNNNIQTKNAFPVMFDKTFTNVPNFSLLELSFLYGMYQQFRLRKLLVMFKKTLSNVLNFC